MPPARRAVTAEEVVVSSSGVEITTWDCMVCGGRTFWYAKGPL